MEIDALLFEAASTLTDPICNAHEAFRRSQVVSEIAKKIFLWLSALVFAFLALFTTLPGIALRGAVSWLKTVPYLSEIAGEGIQLPANRSFSLFSWNVCCVAGGYTITDGGVIPWKERIDAIVKKIIEKEGDVNCLYELFDFHAAQYITEKLKEAGYTQFYYNIGPQGLGVSSGMLVASKYKIERPEFESFPKETLVGRTQFANKGVFSFDLLSNEKTFARIYATHLQHSELPEFPTQEEVQGRKKQMEMLIDRISKIRDRCLVVTGDLNLDDAEYRESQWHYHFLKDEAMKEKTWGGDEYCAKLMEKPVSGPLNLDYTLVWQGTAQRIQSVLVGTGYFAPEFRVDALSDHAGVFSIIQL